MVLSHYPEYRRAAWMEREKDKKRKRELRTTKSVIRSRDAWGEPRTPSADEREISS